MLPFGAVGLGLIVLLLSLITILGVVSVVRPAKRLEQMTQDRVWFAWRLAALECIVTPLFSLFIVYVMLMSGTYPLLLLFVLFSPLVFILQILGSSQQSTYGLKAVKIVLARVAMAFTAVTMLVITESFAVGVVLVGFTFILTWALLLHQTRVVKQALSEAQKTAAQIQIDDVHNWEQELLIKQLKDEEINRHES